MKKIISLFLAVIMVVGVLVSCNGTNDPSTVTTTGAQGTQETPSGETTTGPDAGTTEVPVETKEPLIPETESKISIIQNKQPKAKIIYSAESTLDMELAKEIRTYLLEKLRVYFTVESDDKVKADPNTVEILL